ncbi:hypothetical protein [Methanosarcina sp.]|uniref:hypothetical protein n=1 Tax=Methanosarcina sp. TaxID=2213 RepID=UPI002C7441E4|nr:hypothetical protein [Methanosarcina sp.]HOW15303.1 hypothetical protein [Methanosarcina sp.]
MTACTAKTYIAGSCSAGEVIFYKDSLIIEKVDTTNMREIVYEQVCEWMPVHRWANLNYADQVKICAGTEGTDMQRSHNQTYCPY